MKLRNGHEVTKTLLRFHYCLCWFSYHENINISNNQWIRWAIWILSLISYEKFSQNQELRSLQEMSSNETFQITYRNKQDVLFLLYYYILFKCHSLKLTIVFMWEDSSHFSLFNASKVSFLRVSEKSQVISRTLSNLFR